MTTDDLLLQSPSPGSLGGRLAQRDVVVDLTAVDIEHLAAEHRAVVDELRRVKAQRDQLIEERDEAIELVVRAHELLDDEDLVDGADMVWVERACRWHDAAAPIVGEAT